MVRLKIRLVSHPARGEGLEVMLICADGIFVKAHKVKKGQK